MTDEKQIVNNLKKGSKIAFELLYNRYQNKIFLFAFGYLKSKEKSEGIAQIVFMKLWEKRKYVNETLSFNNFLYKIAKNTILNQIRKNNYHHKYCENYKSKVLVNVDNSTYNSVILSNYEEYLNSIIEQMPEKRKLVFKLSRKDELSNIEIAEKLNLSKRTVDNQIYRAIKQIKESFIIENNRASLSLI